MPGWSGHREVEIWAMAPAGALPALDYHPAERPTERARALPVLERTVQGASILRYRPALLTPGTRYTYTIEGTPGTFTFQTQADWQFKTDPPPFSFLLGSCLYLNDEPYDRPGKPYGQGDNILGLMAASGADFMLWLGDNTYLRPADWTSPAGIWYRFLHERRAPELQPLLRAMHHVATWDDHDFGPNDSARSFPLGPEARAAFRAVWANPPSGLPPEAGIQTSFVWQDCAFILLDNRSHRDENALDPATHPGKSQFGPAQLDWLEQTLLSVKDAPFKFVVMGGQLLKDHNFESFRNHPADRARILAFLERHKIDGVVFLCGDRHFTELNRLPRKNAYPLHELTSSPIGSGIAQRALSEERENPLRVPGTLVDTQNWCRIDVAGPRTARTLTMRSFDKTGTLRWTHTLRADELTHPR